MITANSPYKFLKIEVFYTVSILRQIIFFTLNYIVLSVDINRGKKHESFTRANCHQRIYRG